MKRMLAYSSINHAGFVLLGLQAGDDARASRAALYYLFAYALLGARQLRRRRRRRRPGRPSSTTSTTTAASPGASPSLALAFAVLLLAQAGVPFTTGFFAKLYVMTAAVTAHSYALAVIAMLSAAIAAFFYLRLVFLMYGVRLPAGTGSDRPARCRSRSPERVPDDLEPPEAEASADRRALGPVSVPAPTAVA